MRARERVLLTYEVCVGEKLIYFDFFAACSIAALKSIFDISRPSRCHYMRFRALNTTLKAVILEASKNTKVLIFQYLYHINITTEI